MAVGVSVAVEVAVGVGVGVGVGGGVAVCSTGAMVAVAVSVGAATVTAGVSARGTAVSAGKDAACDPLAAAFVSSGVGVCVEIATAAGAPLEGDDSSDWPGLL